MMTWTETPQPVFVIGTGRSGTRSIFKMLSGTLGVEIHHEYVCTHVQQLSARYSMGLIDVNIVKHELMNLHVAAVHWSDARIWIDCSNKLTWIVQPLIELFPNAKFVNLLRDGRKVANSFIRKLGDEMYDDKSVAAMVQWLADPGSVPMPPPEKKYWWNIPIGEMPMASEFPNFDHFERAVYHWVEANRVARESLSEFVPQNQQMTIRLEDLVGSEEVLLELCQFVGVGYERSYWEALQRPENVIYPMDAKLTRKQLEQFISLASTTMTQLGYDPKSSEYSVDYK